MAGAPAAISSSAKKRRPNFNHEELMAMVTGVVGQREVIEGPLSATVTHAMKVKAWEAVTAAVNVTGRTVRSTEEIKNKYVDFKCHTKKKLCARKKLIMDTGGGPPIAPTLNPTEEAMAQLIDPSVVFGLSDGLESESDVIVSDIIVSDVIVQDMVSLTVVEDEELEQPNSTSRPTLRYNLAPSNLSHSRNEENQDTALPKPTHRVESTSQAASQMLEVQQGILEEVRGMRNAMTSQTEIFQAQTDALNSINVTLQQLKIALEKLWTL